MGIERTDWGREAALLRPAKLTMAVFDAAPALDVARPWIPDRLLPLHGGEGFERLTAAQRLRYNHAYARQLIAEFTWSERNLIVAPLRQLCRVRRLDVDKAAVLQSFISDEIHHIESFSHLEDLAIVADQPASKSPFRPPRMLRALAGLARSYPTRLTFWATVIEGFERQTLKICQEYHRDETVDPLFREIFVTHARDEARHCRFDVLIAGWLESGAGAAWNAFNQRLVSAFLASYRSVDWGLDGPLRELARSHPEIADKVPHLLAEAKALRRATPLPAGSE
jgi:hypothetical protein